MFTSVYRYEQGTKVYVHCVNIDAQTVVIFQTRLSPTAQMGSIADINTTCPVRQQVISRNDASPWAGQPLLLNGRSTHSQRHVGYTMVFEVLTTMHTSFQNGIPSVTVHQNIRVEARTIYIVHVGLKGPARLQVCARLSAKPIPYTIFHAL